MILCILGRLAALFPKTWSDRRLHQLLETVGLGGVNLKNQAHSQERESNPPENTAYETGEQPLLHPATYPVYARGRDNSYRFYDTLMHGPMPAVNYGWNTSARGPHPATTLCTSVTSGGRMGFEPTFS